VEGASVLIISYNSVLRGILARMLSAKGYRIVNRSVGYYGIRTFKKGKGKFDIVVIDSELPDMSGLGVAKKIKEVNRITPIVLLRARKKGVEEEELRNPGVDLAIRKPLFMDKIYDLIENAVASAEKLNAE
jgi:two-component system, OmpR family, alkaline phosphatase synthesis response regulator PhoP